MMHKPEEPISTEDLARAIISGSWTPGVDDTELYRRIRELETKSFTVTAGKYDDGDRNIKYLEDFADLDQAIEAYDKVSGYPWAYIQYKGRTLELWDKGNAS